MWIGRREKANRILLRDPSLMHGEAAAIAAYPGGHNEGFPDTIKQLIGKFYGALRAGRFPQDLESDIPTFESGLRELLLCESIVASARQERWVGI